MAKFLWVFLVLCLTACDDEQIKVPYEDTPTFNAKDPVGVFCRADCSGCDFNADRCKQMVQSNLGSLCDNSIESNCYTIWVKYSQTCEYLCRPNDPQLASQADLVNITFNEGFPM